MKNILLRPAQKEILEYPGGHMGVIAVPGSGKTWTLSLLAANLIASGVLEDDQEVLVVTLVNSAVQNFQRQVASFLEKQRLLPYLGVRVRTLHGLAHDLVRDRPGLVNLDDRFQIVDENEAGRIRTQIVQSWLSSHPEFVDHYLSDDLNESQVNRVVRKDLPGQFNSLANAFIRKVKDYRLTPERLRVLMEDIPVPLPLAEMGIDLYTEYQRALNYRGMVDFDDLIGLALQALETDPDYLERWQHRWPFILEDESQDSSRLQEQILAKLAGKQGNWVRVGDPNQAIFETFTTASPDFLRKFIQREDVIHRNLPNSGRSTQSILDLANLLVDWSMHSHPVQEVQNALDAPPWIEPTPKDDPQPNPEDRPDQVYLFMKKFSAQGEIDAIVKSLVKWLPENKEKTVAVLVSTNTRAQQLVDALQRNNIDFVDTLLRSTSATRISTGVLRDVLDCLADPNSSLKLSVAYRAWHTQTFCEESDHPSILKAANWLQKMVFVEDFLYPTVDRDWLAATNDDSLEPLIKQNLDQFRHILRRWQAAALLPVDQLVLTLAQDLFSEPVDLALSHKLASMLRQSAQTNPNWRLNNFSQELREIAANERRFLGFSDDDTGFDPTKYKGKVVIATMHKAKGLEWDRVYLISVNNYDFPSDPLTDQFQPDKWYIRQKLNLEAETLDQLHTLLSQDKYDWYEEGQGTQNARLEYIREHLRLLYVGITRAKEELVITWNTGMNNDKQPALPFLELARLWQEHLTQDKL